MQSLQQKASEWSGVAASDAFAIDETNLFETLGGIQPFVDLSTNFYNRVYDDEEEWFRFIFLNSKKEDAIRNQYEFFVQRMGGPNLYSQRRGKGNLCRPVYPEARRADGGGERNAIMVEKNAKWKGKRRKIKRIASGSRGSRPVHELVAAFPRLRFAAKALARSDSSAPRQRALFWSSLTLAVRRLSAGNLWGRGTETSSSPFFILSLLRSKQGVTSLLFY